MALVYRHEKLPHRTCHFKSFGPLSDDIALKHTKDIVRDRQSSPCIMDSWSHENAGKHPTIALQRSPTEYGEFASDWPAVRFRHWFHLLPFEDVLRMYSAGRASTLMVGNININTHIHTNFHIKIHNSRRIGLVLMFTYCA